MEKSFEDYRFDIESVTIDTDGLWTIKGKIDYEFFDDGDGENYVFLKKVDKYYTYTSEEIVDRIFSNGYGYYPSNLKLHDVKYINGNISFSEFKAYVVEAFKDYYSGTIERDLNVFINGLTIKPNVN